MKLAATLSLLFALAVSTTGHTQQSTHITYEDEVAKRRNHQVLDDNLFGDKVNLGDGSVVFEHDDISVPLNSGLRLALGRRTPVGRAALGPYTYQDVFADWDLNVPYMKGLYDSRDGWNSGLLDGARCSRGTFIPKINKAAAVELPGMVLPEYYWRGISINIPGKGAEQLLRKNAAQTLPTDGKTYVATTKSMSRVSCLTSLKNGPGEGFAVTTANGLTYHFDWMVKRQVEDRRTWTANNYLIMPLAEYYIHASKVVDRFGNTVTYNYDPANPNRLLSISSNEGGAQIDLQYDAQGRIASATSAGRKWTYGYVNTLLRSLTLPDGTQWTFDLSTISGLLTGNVNWVWMIGYWDARGTASNPGSALGGYGVPAPALMNTGTTTWSLSMTHPSGAKGDFVFHAIYQGTNDTPGATYTDCSSDFGCVGAGTFGVPSVHAVISLAQKKITGPGLADREWRYNYNANWSFSCGNCGASSSETTVTRMDGLIRRYKYGNNYRTNLGQLLSETTEKNGVVVLKNDYTYLASAAGQPFPDNAGDINRTPDPVVPVVAYYPEVFGNPFEVTHRPLSSVTTTVDGTTFSKIINTFDRFVHPTSVTKKSASYIKTEKQEYFDDLKRWIIGQPQRSLVNDIETSRQTFDSNDLPSQFYTFGKLVRTTTFAADGTLATEADGAGAATTFSSWKNGIARAISYPATPDAPSGTSISATVDDNGWLTKALNEVGSATCYTYDAMGRLASITPPAEQTPGACDDSEATWKKTVINFAPYAASAEYGIAAGHWKQTLSNGNQRVVTYYDALWQPLVEELYDATDLANTRRIIVKRYDLDSKPTFQSYPVRTLASYADNLQGTRTSYDALVRVNATEKDSELGVLSTSTVYLPLQTKMTDARGKVTTTSYQMYDSLDYGRPMSIDHPESVKTVIARDIFGKALSITRSGSYLGTPINATRNYVYDAYQRLCKTIEPEVKATVQDYDLANNVIWRATGLDLPGTASCDIASVPATKKVSLSYDSRNRLRDTAYGDGSAGIKRTYTPDGMLGTINSGPSTWSYGYNRRRLLSKESVVVTP
jgi:YD repeat-containing protein